MIDLLQIGDTKPEVPGRRNVSWLAIEQILRGVVMKFVIVCSDALGIVLPQRRCAPLPPRLFNCRQFDGVHGDGIRGYKESAGLIDKVLHLGERTAVPHLPHTVHDMQHGL